MSNPNHSDAVAERNEQLHAEYEEFLRSNPFMEWPTFEEWVDLK